MEEEIQTDGAKLEEVEELVKRGRGKVKEIVMTLNTAESGEATQVTDTINGVLEAVIIDAQFPVQVQIGLMDYENIVLYNVVNFVGQKYEPIRTPAMYGDKERGQYNFSPEKWVLNDKLIVTIKGPVNTEVKFIIKYM